MAMELHIEEYQVTPEIKFNFEEIKAGVAEKVSYYKDLVYTDEQIKEAKADRANLRKFVDALDNRRKEVKAEILKPYLVFEGKLDEIKSLVQEPIQQIDTQVKEYEAIQKRAKEESIRQTFINKGYAWMADIIWNPKWLNATCSMKAITEEIDARIFTYETDIKILDELDEYQFEAIEHYKKTLDLGSTMVLVNQLKDQAKRRAEYQAQKREEKQMEIDIDDESTVYHPPVKEWISFSAKLSTEDAKALKEFFNSRNIEFKKI
ncbi:MAG: DUF1351 domain-containing protein [Lachnospiraceae bacterium]|nr:DUF1351 domain-containing protein [Lachnospiraceae bacterium]